MSIYSMNTVYTSHMTIAHVSSVQNQSLLSNGYRILSSQYSVYTKAPLHTCTLITLLPYASIYSD
jgi:hypothetical protein